MKAKSIKGKSTGEIISALQTSIADGFKPTLAIVFISIKQDRKAICEMLHQNEIDIIGATSSGEFIDGHQDEGAIVILLLNLSKAYFTILFQDVGNMTVSEAATQMAQAALKHFSNPAFILCSTGVSSAGKMMDGETLIRSIENVVGSHANMFGGMAGDDLTFTGTYVFTYNQSTDYGMVALVLNEDKIALHGMAISGWKPIGLSRTVTKSEGNVIHTIDDQPALDMYMRYLGSVLPSADNQIEFFENLGNQYPIQIERDDREPLMCNPTGFDRE
ncbi:MAG: FIST N-terminal domain-containing protein, partial [Chitinophagaceae bacterium]